MTSTIPSLPESTKPHPLEVALAALSEAATELLAGNRPNRFAEMQMLAQIAMSIQRLRPGIGVDDVLQENDDFQVQGMVQMAGPPVMAPNPRFRHRAGAAAPFHEEADLNREIIMIAQRFLEKYLETEQTKAKRPTLESRLDIVTELSELMALRLRLMTENQSVHASINTRIDYLLQRIGEPAHEPEPEHDPVVHPEPLRGYPADGPVEPDGGRVGEPVAERAAGDGRAG